MTITSSSQKFIAQHRAPRVQIEYDVELYGATRRQQLPFVFGVLADLSGQPTQPLPPLAERAFAEIDADNFDERLKAMRPRVCFHVPDVLRSTPGASMPVDLVFESMDDFAPDAIARRLPVLRDLLEARTRLKDLLASMDGKAGAEQGVHRLLASPELLGHVAGPDAPPTDLDAPPPAAPR